MMNWRHSTASLAACLLMIAGPALGTLVLLRWLGVRLGDFAPATSDEIGYYLQVSSFAHHSFSGGYFTISEFPAAASFSHFGVHGPLFPMLYGSLGKVLGWHFYSGPLFNIVLITAAIGIYGLLVRPTFRQALLAAAILSTFLPFYVTLLAAQQDSLHLAIAIVVAAGFSGMLRRESWVHKWIFHGWFLGLLVYASLMRISWSMFLLPYCLLQVPNPTPRRLLLAALMALVAIGSLLYMFRWLCAPYVGAPGAFLMNKIAGGEVSAKLVWTHALGNLKRLREGNLSAQPMLLGTIVFWEAIGFASIMAAYALGPSVGISSSQVGYQEVLFHAFNIWGLLVGIVIFYFVGSDGGWRMLAVHLLISSLIAVTSPLWWLRGLMAGMVVVNLAYLPRCTETLADINGQRFVYGPAIRSFARTIKGLIEYRQGADPWWNTMLVGPYPVELAGLPAGIGVSFFVRPGHVSLPIKSRYVLASEEIVRKQHWQLIEVARFPALHNSMGYDTDEISANLYLNPAASAQRPPR
jgi:hypothetical protein